MKYAAFGTILRRGDGADPEVFAAIAHCGDMTGPGMSTASLDVTAHDSPDDTREKLPSLKDGGEHTLTIFFDPTDTTHLALKSDWDTRRVGNYQLQWPDADDTVCTFAAFITNLTPAEPVAGELTCAVTFTVSGAPSWS